MIFDRTMTRALTLRNDIAISDSMLTRARVTNACNQRLKYFMNTMNEMKNTSPIVRAPAAMSSPCMTEWSLKEKSQ